MAETTAWGFIVFCAQKLTIFDRAAKRILLLLSWRLSRPILNREQCYVVSGRYLPTVYRIIHHFNPTTWMRSTSQYLEPWTTMQCVYEWTLNEQYFVTCHVQHATPVNVRHHSSLCISRLTYGYKVTMQVFYAYVPRAKVVYGHDVSYRYRRSSKIRSWS